MSELACFIVTMIVTLMQKIPDTLIARFLLVGTVIILALIPFHATLTVWLSSLGLNYAAIRLWKEVLLLLLFAGAVYLFVSDKKLRLAMLGNKYLKLLFVLIDSFILLHLILGLVFWWLGDVSLQAIGYSFISNLRFLVFFVIAMVVGYYYRNWIQRYWMHLLLWPALVVIGFGLLQEYILPYDFLRHFGYGPETIKPYIAVDRKVEYTRLQSTMRGPNPLGAYLVIIMASFSALFIVRKTKYFKIALALLATMIVLYGTYSRSAWIGVVATLGVLVWSLIQSAKARKVLVIIGAFGLLLGVIGVYVLRDNDRVQNVLFHTDENSKSSTSSNENRASALLSGARDIAKEPLGGGPGTAGPASVYNEEDTSRISENYFLQIGQEVGVIGLGIFTAICVTAGIALYKVGSEENILPLILLASLVGLTLVNMLSHAWADDTLAYIWWGFAGLALGASYGNLKGDETAKKTAKAV